MDAIDTYPVESQPHWYERGIQIILIGAGGNGSEMLNCLTRIHFGLLARGHTDGLHVTVIDDDICEKHNCIRQNFWPSDVGEPKAQCFIEKANYLLGVKWEYVPIKFPLGKGYDKGLPAGFDIVITCVDNLSCRKALYEAFRETNTSQMWLDLGNEQYDGQVVLGHLGKCINHIPNVVERYPEILTKRDMTTVPTCSEEQSLSKQDLFINRKVAGAAGNMLWQLFVKGRIENTHIHVDAAKMEELVIG